MIEGREIALANLTVLDASPPGVVDAAAAAGFDSVTLRLAGGGTGDPNPLVGDTPTRRETIARLRHHGIGVLDMEVIRLREDTEVAELAPVLESAAAIGARHVLVISQDADEDRVVEHFAEICEAAHGFGMSTVLEFMVFTAIKTVEQADRIIERARHPGGAVLVDPLHLRRSGGSPADVAELVALNADRYPYAQLCDGLLATPGGRGPALYAEAVEDRLAPGEGELPLAELLAALPAGAALSVEAPVAAYAHLGAGERAQRLIAATRRLLEG